MDLDSAKRECTRTREALVAVEAKLDSAEDLFAKINGVFALCKIEDEAEKALFDEIFNDKQKSEKDKAFLLISLVRSAFKVLELKRKLCLNTVKHQKKKMAEQKKEFQKKEDEALRLGEQALGGFREAVEQNQKLEERKDIANKRAFEGEAKAATLEEQVQQLSDWWVEDRDKRLLQGKQLVETQRQLNDAKKKTAELEETASTAEYKVKILTRNYGEELSSWKKRAWGARDVALHFAREKTNPEDKGAKAAINHEALQAAIDHVVKKRLGTGLHLHIGAKILDQLNHLRDLFYEPKATELPPMFKGVEGPPTPKELVPGVVESKLPTKATEGNQGDEEEKTT